MLADFLPRAEREFRIMHFGWATSADRAAKLGRYQRLDPDAIYGSREQYATILDTDPNLVAWHTK